MTSESGASSEAFHPDAMTALLHKTSDMPQLLLDFNGKGSIAVATGRRLVSKSKPPRLVPIRLSFLSLPAIAGLSQYGIQLWIPAGNDGDENGKNNQDKTE